MTSFLLEDNNLNNRDLSNNTNLYSLYLSNNNLSSIDLSHNTESTALGLANNNLKSINLEKINKLTSLRLSNNNLTGELDLSHIEFNMPPSSIDLSNNNLTKVKLSNIQGGEGIDLSNNNLTEVVLSNIDTSYPIILINNNINKVELNNIKAYSIRLDHNNLNSLDISNDVNIGMLSVSNNKLSEIIGLKDLQFLIAYNNNLLELNLGLSENLQGIILQNNPMTNTKYIIKGKEIEYNPIALNEKYDITTSISDEEVISLENNKLKALKEGTSTIKKSNQNIMNLDADMYERVMAGEEINEEDAMLDYFFLQEIKVYDITSDKYNIDKDKKEITYSGEFNNDNITLTLDGLTGIVEDNNYVIKDGETLVDTYKLVVTSKEDNKSDSKLTTKKNTINTTKKSNKKSSKVVDKTTTVKVTTNEKQKEIINKLISKSTTKEIKEDNKDIKWYIIVPTALAGISLIGFVMYKRSK